MKMYKCDLCEKTIKRAYDIKFDWYNATNAQQIEIRDICEICHHKLMMCALEIMDALQQRFIRSSL